MTVFSVHFDLQAPNAVKQLLGLIDLYRPNNIYRQLKSVNRSPICPRLKAAAALYWRATKFLQLRQCLPCFAEDPTSSLLGLECFEVEKRLMASAYLLQRVSV